MLGVCLGAELLAEAGGGEVRRAPAPEIGWHTVELTDDAATDPVLGGLPLSFEAFQWHSYEFALPPGATELARSDVCSQAFRLGDSSWGIQFHAEVALADAERWITDYRNDPDAIAIGLDPGALGERPARIGTGTRWNAAFRPSLTGPGRRLPRPGRRAG